MECKGALSTASEIFNVVLIETLWNVKSFSVACSLACCRINRNIMECKVNQRSDRSGVALCVLIETLWNVKVGAAHPFRFSSFVLIETLWNVKLSGRSSKRISAAVLIETLWNVKCS